LCPDEEEVGQAKPSAVPAKENPNNPGRRKSRSSVPAPVFHPPEYRGVLANWPDEWREQWGHRANALEATGLSWRDAEAQAFVEVWNRLRGQQPAQSHDSAVEPAIAAAGAEND
jgi:hypothetical protein